MNNTAILTGNTTLAHKPRRSLAVFKKQLRDTMKNKVVLAQFVLFPLIGFAFTELVGKSMQDMPSAMFGTMFATMYAGMVPLVNTASLIAEEKENNTLRVLMMAGVKHWQYLLGTGLYILCGCGLGAVAFGFICGYTGADLLVFISGMLLGILCSLMLGFTVGLHAKNQMGATTLAMPISMVAAFLPLVGMFNERLASVSRFLYTEQISKLLENPAAGLGGGQLLILGANFAVFLALFVLAYRRESRAK